MHYEETLKTLDLVTLNFDLVLKKTPYTWTILLDKVC
jgi:hypothetical protein